MYWLWIPAVVLLSVFSLVLCWYFFSDYKCFPCPCRRNRYESSVLPTAVPSLRPSLTPPRPSLTPPRHPNLVIAPSAPPSTPEVSPVVRLHFGAKKLHNIVYEEGGIPTLDLHNMTVLEARSATQGFLHRQRASGCSVMKVITGRGLHSQDHQPKLKPMVKNILLGESVNFRETNQGGAYLIHL